MGFDPNPRKLSVGVKVAVMAMTAVLFALAKGLTGYVPSPWGVGELFFASFVPMYLVTVTDTLSVAVGAGLGSFIGDMIFLLPVGATNPPLALVAGVPTNFAATFLFGWIVKKYRSWPSFVTATVGALTLGNLTTATLVATVGPQLFAPLSSLTSLQAMGYFALGLTAFWDTTSIPAVLILVPVLLRATSPLVGRSVIINQFPDWSKAEARSLAPLSVVYAVIFLALGAFFFLVPWGGSITDITSIKSAIFVVAASLAVIGPLVGRMAGSKKVEVKAGI